MTTNPPQRILHYYRKVEPPSSLYSSLNEVLHKHYGTGSTSSSSTTTAIIQITNIDMEVSE